MGQNAIPIDWEKQAPAELKVEVFPRIYRKTSPDDSGDVRLSKSLAEFAARAANKVQIIFDRGMYVGKNTDQAASVEFVR